MSDKVERAILLAKFVHLGQKRRDGEDYFNHCIRVAQTMGYVAGYKREDEDNICVAFLHDTIEDGKNPGLIGRIILEWFGEEIHTVVCILTHDKKESYIEYITRVFRHSTAWIIKFQDMIDNTSYEIPEKQKTKYRDTCIHLMAHGVTVPDILKERLEI